VPTSWKLVDPQPSAFWGRQDWVFAEEEAIREGHFLGLFRSDGPGVRAGELHGLSIKLPAGYPKTRAVNSLPPPGGAR
jgi:hypothetical protein